jgi:hypothetical protein
MNFAKCFPDSIFKNKEEVADFICPINLGVYNDPVTDTCGHTFCKRCILEWLKNNNKCPYSRKLILAEELIEATEKADEIIQKGIVCSFRGDGCMWEGKLPGLPIHFGTDCGFTKIRCQSFEKCGTETLRKLMSAHYEKCDFRVLACDFCKKTMEQQHYQV